MIDNLIHFFLRSTTYFYECIIYLKELNNVIASIVIQLEKVEIQATLCNGETENFSKLCAIVFQDLEICIT